LFVAHLEVPKDYWTTIELSRARQCNKESAAPAALAPGIKDAADLVIATRKVPQCARLMLSFLIDRPVPERTNAQDFPGAHRIVERTDDPDPPGFQVQQSAGSYKLLVSNMPSR